MNKRITLSFISIMAMAGLVAGATFAFFSSSASSNNNTFASGTLNLLLDDNNESTPAATVTASLGAGNLAPGQTTSGFISLHNGGTINMAEIKFGANETSNTNNSDGSDLASVLALTIKTGSNSTCTGGTDQTTAINNAIGGGGGSPVLTLAELNAADYDSLPGINAGNDLFLCVDATMDSTAGNIYQGDAITENFVFEGHQDASQ